MTLSDSGPNRSAQPSETNESVTETPEVGIVVGFGITILFLIMSGLGYLAYVAVTGLL